MAYDPASPVITEIERMMPGVQLLRPGSLAIRARGPAEILVNDSHGDMQNLLHTELDPEVTRIAQHYFGLRREHRITTVHGDARAFASRGSR